MSSEPIIEMGQNIPAFVDELSIVKPMGAVTHLVFSARQPEADRTTSITRIVQVRLIVPTDQLNTMAKAMLAREAAVRMNGDDAWSEPAIH
jgi:hypothetical protein